MDHLWAIVLAAALPSCDFSRDLLQPSAKAITVLPIGRCGWTDLGTPSRIQAFLQSTVSDETPSSTSHPRPGPRRPEVAM